MSTTFFITLIPPHKLMQMSENELYSEQDFTINTDQILKRLQELWKDLQISRYEDEIEWEYQGEHGTISGTLRANQNISTMSDASVEYMSTVAKIYRDIIPDEYAIYIFHLGEPKPLVLRGGAIINELNLFDFRE